MPHKPPNQDDSANKPPSATARALRLLCHKSRSAAELRQLLAKEGYDEGACAEAVAATRTWGYVHDDRLAEALEQSATRRGRGSRWLARQLAVRQVTGPLTQALAARHEKEEPANIDALLRRRFGGPDKLATPRDRARAARFLLGRGFSPRHVMDGLKRASTAAGHDDEVVGEEPWD